MSRHINRRLSGRITRFLLGTGVTPNQASLAAFVTGVAAGVALAAGIGTIGGLLAQLSSVLDGVDGELARARAQVTRFGGFFDAVLDRYADTAILLGMMIWAGRGEPSPAVAIVGLLAVAGSLLVSYTRARAEASVGIDFGHGPVSWASRDVRLLVVMLGAWLAQPVCTLLFLALLTNVVVVGRILLVRREHRAR